MRATQPPSEPSRRGVEGRRRWSAAYAFIAPALALLGLFFLIPVAAAFVLSLTDYDIYALADPANLRFVGMRNYSALASDPLFRRALGNTVNFVAAGGILTIAAALGAALAVTAAIVRAKALFRTLLFVPAVTSIVAVAVVWRYLYHPRFGLLNAALAAVGVGPFDWLGDPRLAMPAIVVLAVWKNFGANMVVFMAGVLSIPERLYEAATVDGAGVWARFRHVTVPMLRPTFVFVGVMTLIGYFQLFAEPYVMTEGGPAHSTLSLVLYMYEEGFRWWSLGYAAALAFVLFAIILAVSAMTRLRAGVSRDE